MVRRFHFDSGSEDDTIVASVKASSGLTSGGKLPTAKTKDAYTDVPLLTMVGAKLRILVLSDPEFRRIFSTVADGRVPAGVSFVHMSLPRELQSRVWK